MRAPLLITAFLFMACGPSDGQAPPLQEPLAPPPAADPATAPPFEGQPVAQPAEPAAKPAPTLPAKPEGTPCVAWKPASPMKDAESLVADVANQGIGALQAMSCTPVVKTPPPCDAETCDAWVRYLSYDALVLYQKFEVDSAIDQALLAVKTGRECGLTGQSMARAYVAMGYLLIDAKNEMVKASNAFRWAFLMKWNVDLPFPSPPPNVKMTFQAAKASLGPTEFTCAK